MTAAKRPRVDLSRFIPSQWRGGLPLVFIGSLVLVFVVGIATVRESYRGWKVDGEIQALQAQADVLEGRNAKLRQLASALQSDDRMEVEARTRLGMQAPGEHVVILSGLEATSTWQSSLALDVMAQAPTIERSNPQKWFDYFFRPDHLTL